MDWIDLAHDTDRWWAVVNTVMNRRVAQDAGNFFTILGHVSVSGSTLLRGIS
jgi:hypothetical protein